MGHCGAQGPGQLQGRPESQLVSLASGEAGQHPLEGGHRGVPPRLGPSPARRGEQDGDRGSPAGSPGRSAGAPERLAPGALGAENQPGRSLGDLVLAEARESDDDVGAAVPVGVAGQIDGTIAPTRVEYAFTTPINLSIMHDGTPHPGLIPRALAFELVTNGYVP